MSLSALLTIVSLAAMVGCKGNGEKPVVDETVGRYAQKGSVAYAEGQIDEAIQDYRRAIHRAWSIDDAYESGTNAYNLAACMISAGRSAEAKDWLLDSRVELCRAGASPGNVYLLQAKVALSESRLEDVYRYVDHAACSDAPCVGEGCECKQGPGDPCRDGCVTKIPCVGPKIKEAKATKDCENAFQAQVELTRARLAAEQYDIPVALQHLSRACELLDGICGYDMQADLHDVAALIHLAKGEYLQAACHLDREAECLRCAGIYREIPSTLELAAAAFEQAGRNDLAAKRLCRVARIRYGRGDLDQSWQDLQSASALAGNDDCDTTQVRLALLAHEISQSLGIDNARSSAETQQPETRSNTLDGPPPSSPQPDSAAEPMTPAVGNGAETLPAPNVAPEPDPQTNVHRLDAPGNPLSQRAMPPSLTTQLPSFAAAPTGTTAAQASSILPVAVSEPEASCKFPGSRSPTMKRDCDPDLDDLRATRLRNPKVAPLDPCEPTGTDRNHWPSLNPIRQSPL